MKLSIAIPVYNEEESIEKVLQEIFETIPQIVKDYEIIVVNDGSTDKTKEILEKYRDRITIIHHPERKGVGKAIKDALYYANMEWVLFIPGDGQQPIEEIKKFLRWVKDYDVLLGYRKKREDPFYRLIFSFLWRKFLYFLFGLRIRDPNWIKMIKKQVLEELKLYSETAFLDTELILKAEKKGYRIKEIGVMGRKRYGGRSKCLSLSTILKAVRDALYYRRNRRS